MTPRRDVALRVLGTLVAVVLAMLNACMSGRKAERPVDPGVRGGPMGAGSPLNNLTADENTFFRDGCVFQNQADSQNQQLADSRLQSRRLFR
jgi:hypothetical protein